MGYPMASTLRSRMSKEQTLYILDDDRQIMEQFKTESASGDLVKVVSNPFEAAKAAVGVSPMLP